MEDVMGIKFKALYVQSEVLPFDMNDLQVEDIAVLTHVVDIGHPFFPRSFTSIGFLKLQGIRNSEERTYPMVTEYTGDSVPAAKVWFPNLATYKGNLHNHIPGLKNYVFNDHFDLGVSKPYGMTPRPLSDVAAFMAKEPQAKCTWTNLPSKKVVLELVGMYMNV